MGIINKIRKDKTKNRNYEKEIAGMALSLRAYYAVLKEHNLVDEFWKKREELERIGG